MALRRRLEDRLRRVLHAFNFREVQTPTFEELELFEKKAGAGVRDEIYEFKDKSGRELCLRPELTLPVMRFYFGSQLKVEPKPLRLFYFGPCYRYDRPQAGRYREFWQVGVELVGDASPEAHAELLWLALQVFEASGLSKIVLRVGHLAILRSLIESMLGVLPTDQGPLMRLIDKKDLEGIKAHLAGRTDAKRVEEFLSFFELGDLEAAKKAFPGSPRTQEAYDQLARVMARLDGFGADATKLRFDPTIARGLEYYTGLVFELDCPDLGAEKQLLGGGEYDLSAVFDATPEPTVGFALGFDRTLVALEKTGKLPEVRDRVDVLVAALSEKGTPAAQRIANALRELDLRVELDLSGRGPKRALQRGSAVKAKCAVLLGEREIDRGVAALKNLDTGEQVEVPTSEVAARLQPWVVAN